MLLTLTDLPTDIHDTIAAFLPDKDLLQFVCASRQIAVSAYLLRQRQRAYWKECGVEALAKKGDLAGLQYLHGLTGALYTHNTMTGAAEKGHLAVVQFLHSIGTPCKTCALDWAAMEGHLAVVQFLHSIGAPYTTYAMNRAAQEGHLAMVQFLHSIGAPHTNKAMDWAAEKGHLAMVQFLHSIGAPFTEYAMDSAAANGRLAMVQFLHGIGAPFTDHAMDWAAAYGHLAVVKFLHSIGAPHTELAMSWAVGNGHLAVLEFLTLSNEMKLSLIDSKKMSEIKILCSKLKESRVKKNNMAVDLFSIIRVYILLLSVFFYFMYSTNATWFSNKLIYYVATVYVPFFMFATILLASPRNSLT